MRIDRTVFGYVTLKIAPEDIKKAATALLTCNLSASFSHSGEFKVSYPSLKKYEKALLGISYTVSDVKGLFGVLLKNKKRYGVFSGLFILIVYFALVSGVIWDIRIEGESDISAALVYEELSEAGMKIGSRWSSLSQSKVERTVLENSSDIGWININRRGNVAYISVKQKNAPDIDTEIEGCCNIIAAYDCVIEEIRVERGIACVKAGDTVKRGQLLVSGIIPAELGGGFVRASAEIKGRVSEEISVLVPREEKSLIYEEEKLSSLYLKIFNFSINIFKSYGKKDEGCVIINDREELVLFGKRLPIGIYRTYIQKTSAEFVSKSDSELLDAAAYRLSKLRALKLSDAEILKMSTFGEFSDNGYEMRSSVVVLREIGEEKRFD